ncbi:hypothetical protein [Saccharibacillus alkalitolerans]|uniref:Uncharacterized protein n=1 Tax=Saccharibacillus alkalitolerans TaxID=2705290 RepID=A0ABX0EZV2_9BACL|nr:hypothetical protein [Saccharibacillus alkalitolerans]NGZ73735.1 hypothetical protein [Saccharibacillus alkalitolerans]
MSYGESGGELRQADEEQILPIEELLYGPYSGEPSLLLTLSELPATMEEGESRSVDGIDMQIARAPDGSLHAIARAADVTYTLQSSTEPAYDEDRMLDILAKIARGTSE